MSAEWGPKAFTHHRHDHLSVARPGSQIQRSLSIGVVGLGVDTFIEQQRDGLEIGTWERSSSTQDRLVQHRSLIVLFRLDSGAPVKQQLGRRHTGRAKAILPSFFLASRSAPSQLSVGLPSTTVPSSSSSSSSSSFCTGGLSCSHRPRWDVATTPGWQVGEQQR